MREATRSQAASWLVVFGAAALVAAVPSGSESVLLLGVMVPSLV
ncbi:MAG: hypothetical protein ACON4I_06550 [Candidatus Puniceispirillaceae bacterium]